MPVELSLSLMVVNDSWGSVAIAGESGVGAGSAQMSDDCDGVGAGAAQMSDDCGGVGAGAAQISGDCDGVGAGAAQISDAAWGLRVVAVISSELESSLLLNTAASASSQVGRAAIAF